MIVKTMAEDRRRLYALIVSGVFAGVSNGLLGAGGGIVLVLALSILLGDGAEAVKNNFATTIMAILPISAVSLSSYAARGMLNLDFLPMLIVPAIIGGMLGAFLLDRINTKFLKLLFAVLVIYAGVNMVIK